MTLKRGLCVKILFRMLIPLRRLRTLNSVLLSIHSRLPTGDNQNGLSGQALEFKKLNLHAWEAFDKGQDVHMLAVLSQAELCYKNFKVAKEQLKSRVKETRKKYGNAATEEEIPRELLLGQSENQAEYDHAGPIIKGQEMALLNSKYEEDVYANNHTSI